MGLAGAGSGSTALRIACRGGLAAFLTAVFILLGCAGVLVTTEARWISLLVEPLSLLLLPGLVVALVAAGPHDFSVPLVLQVSAVFWLIVCWSLLSRRNRGPRASL